MIGLGTDVDEHVERLELLQERLGVVVIVDPVIRHVPCHTEDASTLETFQFLQGHVVADHCDTLVASLTTRDGIEHAGIVEAIARVRPDQQRAARAVRVHQAFNLCRRAQLLAGRRVMRVCLVRETHRVEHVHVAVDLRLLEDSGIHDPSA